MFVITATVIASVVSIGIALMMIEVYSKKIPTLS